MVPVKFVSLHHHSTYSWLDGFGHPSQHVERAVELDMGALALTEHGTVSSHVKLEQAARKSGIQPIFGCELYTGGPEPTQRKNHLSVWSENEEGYRDLLRMVSWAWKEGFYYEPTVTGPVFARHSEHLIVGSGCTGSLLATSLIGGKNVEPADASFERGLRVAHQFRDLLGDRYYLEVQQFPELKDSTCLINPMLERIGKKLGIPLVATADVHYCRPEDNEMQKILHAVRPGNRRTVEDQARAWSYDVLLCHPTSDLKLLRRLEATGLSKQAARQAIASTAEIAGRCQFSLPKAAPLRFPSGEKSTVIWRRWLKEGWKFRNIDAKPRAKEYAERLKYEAEMIESKDFVDYFLIVSDMTKWAKESNIFVGPARGSAAGSLVCYLLRITEVDPMIFPDLVFERFIDITRKDLPDIDLDFDDERRHEVFEYLRGKYGEERVNQLGTFSTYKSKMALDDVARVYSVPKWEVDKVKELLLTRSSGDLRASATIEDTVAMFPEAQAVFTEFPDMAQSTRIEGMVKGMGKHAAGAIVASQPLTDICAVYDGKISIDKFDAEYLNLLKIDTLGLNTCGMLSHALSMIGKTIQDLYEVPLDDEETIRGFQEGDVVGIFQFDGRAMRLVNNNLKPDNFYEVCVVNALARPGPLHNNATTYYIDIKHGDMKPEFTHPLFDPIVANTMYQVVYQEQILRIVREIGLFDWTASTHIRKIISHKEGDQAFNREWKRFWKGAKSQGMNEEIAAKIWGMCITAGSYAFNAAHAVSYGMLGYWCMWLKRHHPLVFYTAALRRMPDTKILELLRDASRHGIKILPPDPERSSITWESDGDHSILAGFSAIPGIGPKQSEAIMAYREENDLGEWEDLIEVKGIGQKTIQNILEWVYQEDPLGVHVLDKKMDKVIAEIKAGKLNGASGKLPTPTHRTADVPSMRGEDTQVVWIGTVTNRNLRDLFEVNFSRTGVALDPKKVRDPHLREWVLLYGTDGDDILTLNIDRWHYGHMKHAIWNIRLGHDLVLIQGVKKGRLPQKIVHVSKMWVLD